MSASYIESAARDVSFASLRVLIARIEACQRREAPDHAWHVVEWLAVQQRRWIVVEPGSIMNFGRIA